MILSVCRREGSECCGTGRDRDWWSSAWHARSNPVLRRRCVGSSITNNTNPDKFKHASVFLLIVLIGKPRNRERSLWEMVSTVETFEKRALGGVVWTAKMELFENGLHSGEIWKTRARWCCVDGEIGAFWKRWRQIVMPCLSKAKGF